mmetsp:Transcript_53989/g.89943  ORF Transcript_53989/g.89943 Transcript_53989/m.89943 type:complete len:242 (-) Transcript_53989:677-1402(-)
MSSSFCLKPAASKSPRDMFCFANAACSSCLSCLFSLSVSATRRISERIWAPMIFSFFFLISRGVSTMDLGVPTTVLGVVSFAGLSTVVRSKSTCEGFDPTFVAWAGLSSPFNLLANLDRSSSLIKRSPLRSFGSTSTSDRSFSGNSSWCPQSGDELRWDSLECLWIDLSSFQSFCSFSVLTCFLVLRLGDSLPLQISSASADGRLPWFCILWSICFDATTILGDAWRLTSLSSLFKASISF